MNPKNVRYEIIVHPEDQDVRGNAMASGDDAFDLECEDAILADLEGGNPWAWCCVEVRATLRGFPGIVGHDYLGCCSYKDEADFRRDGYYEDMKAEAMEGLCRQYEAALAAYRVAE